MRKIYLLTAIIIAVSTLQAQDSTKSLTFSGSVDAYYRFNFGQSDSGGHQNINNYTAFTNSQNSFELGMASIRADGSALSGKVSGTADLGFGRRAEEFSYNDASSFAVGGANANGFNSLFAIKQLYVSYMPAKNLKLTLGKWATHIGYELLDAYANRNYSMDYMFSYGPFSHTGLKAEYTAGSCGFMLGLANPTDNATTTSNVKTLLAQVSAATKNGKIKGYLNYQGAFMPSFKANQIDLVVLGTVSSKFNIGYNGTVVINSFKAPGVKDSTANWWGSALYFNYDPTSSLGLTLRGEYVGDKDFLLTTSGAWTGPGHTKNLYDVTLSLNYKVGPLTIIPEIRIDGSDSPIFWKKKDFVDGDPSSKTTATALLAMIYKF